MGLLKKLTIFITGFILCLSSVAGALESGEFSQSDYETVLNTIANDDDFEEKFYIEKLQRFHFVFVGGFVNELAKDYFTDNKLSLEAFGAGKVSIVMPSSAHSARDNLAWLQDKVESLFEDGGRLPIILVGHSKGGLESAALIINNPDLVRKKIVSAVVTVQSPLSGCEMGSCSSEKFVATKNIGLMQGLHSLSNQEIKSLIADPLQIMPASTRKMLSKRVFYITSYQENSKQAMALRMAKGLAKQVMKFDFSLPNDGLVSEPTMVIPNFGQRIGNLVGDHVQFTVSPSVIGWFQGITTSKKEGIWGFSYLLGKYLMDRLNPAANMVKSSHLTCSRFYEGFTGN